MTVCLFVHLKASARKSSLQLIQLPPDPKILLSLPKDSIAAAIESGNFIEVKK
jgi:hypothetical protein